MKHFFSSNSVVSGSLNETIWYLQSFCAEEIEGRKVTQDVNERELTDIYSEEVSPISTAMVTA